MNTLLFKRVDTSVLYPPFLALVSQAVDACVTRGAYYVALSGERTWAEQDALYAKGRTTPPLGQGHIVTKARAGQSPHNYAVALDFALHKGVYTGKLLPDFSDKAYEMLAEESEKVGLEAGLHWSSFKDAPHIQLPIKKLGYTWAQLADVYRKTGKVGLFAELDKHYPVTS